VEGRPLKVEPWMDEMIDRLVAKMKKKEEFIHFRDDDVFNESWGWDAKGIIERRGLFWGDGLIHVEFDYGYRWEAESDGVRRVRSEEMTLRYLLWLRHGCDGLYGDDGEMQCAACAIDFKRDPVDHIAKRFHDNGLAQLMEEVSKDAEAQ